MCERSVLSDRLELLAEIMDEVEECLSLALEMKDRETVARMTEVADDLARYARRSLALHVVTGSSRRKLHS
jgi:K+-sensing histidine kinase KdpD